jgi:hypothetical protein
MDVDKFLTHHPFGGLRAMALGPTICPKCGTLVVVTLFNLEDAKCPRNECGYVFNSDETTAEYRAKKQQQEVKNWDAKQAALKAKKKLMGIEVAALEIAAKSDPVVRSTEYLSYLRNGGFPIRNDIGNGAHIYVIELQKSVEKYLNKRAFPNNEHPQIVGSDDDGFKGHVYVGHTQRKLKNSQSEVVDGDPVVYRFKYEHKKVKNSVNVVKYHSKTDDFETCARELTERYGFRNVSIVKPNYGELESEKLESWVGYMLYKLGYWVWGPHAHLPKHREKYGDFLGKGIYI